MFLYHKDVRNLFQKMRFLGKDLLRINKNKTISTYWINRDKQKNTMKKQF